MTTHRLKSCPEPFQRVADGTKTFEIRKNDRFFAVGDTVILREWKPKGRDPSCEVHHYLEPDGRCSCGSKGTYTGQEMKVKIPYITDFCQRDGYVVMSIVRL